MLLQKGETDSEIELRPEKGALEKDFFLATSVPGAAPSLTLQPDRVSGGRSEFHDRQDDWIDAYQTAQHAANLLGESVQLPIRMPPIVSREEAKDWYGKYSGHCFKTRPRRQEA